MKDDSIIGSIFNTAHFYLSLILGWMLFHGMEYSALYSASCAPLPLYVLHLLAFGSLVYVGTRPFAVLLEALLARARSR